MHPAPHEKNRFNFPIKRDPSQFLNDTRLICLSTPQNFKKVIEKFLFSYLLVMSPIFYLLFLLKMHEIFLAEIANAIYF